MPGEILLTAVNAVLPIVLIILLGYLLRRVGFFNDGFIKTGNKFVFRFCLPCTLFINVYSMSATGAVPWDVAIYCVVMVTVLFLLGMAVSVLTTKDRSRRGVIWQCCFRSNFAIIGLSLAGALGGEQAMAVAAIVSAFTVPAFNILAVIALSMFLEGSGSGKNSIRGVLGNIAKNPLIISVALGLVCLGIRSVQEAAFGEVVFRMDTQTKFLYKAVDNLASIASPFALLVLGGQFEFSAVRGLLKEIVVSTVWRIVLAPLIGIGGAILLSAHTGLLHCGVNEYPALVAMFGSPVAVSSAIMAGSMKNDEQLATQLVVWTSLLSIVTIFATVCLLMWMGLIAV